jgi:beta-galactosidase
MGFHRRMDGHGGGTKVTPMRLGVCYYPEHWPEAMWADDARRMVEMGISRVRIGEFAWGRIEPDPARFDWDWLDRAIETLYGAGLGIILGTPTATPPKWLVDQMPDMIAIDAQGKPRGFGSRRHYCFSYAPYQAEAARITAAMAERYGTHPGIVAWQTDNEFGCHDTVLSYSTAAQGAFRLWLAARYGEIGKLNSAWGTVFWSQEYRHFGEIDLPNLTVTEPNPAHCLDFRRFSSDQVVRFNKAQVDIIRAASPGRDVVHNFMGFFTEFDHHDVGADLDVATWDSYPLGFLEQFWFSDAEKAAYGQQGHPDIAAFHHDLYRGCSAGRWAVMEQQPGPVNWARFNPAPLPGMVRLWTLEAMAHGAELVSYFRWRQFPQAQEQMHAGLLRPDSVDDIGAREARAAADDIAVIGAVGAPPKSVALIFGYDADWVTSIQPQGKGFSALRLAFEFYSALRAQGLDIDILPPSASLDGYDLIVIPCLPIVPDHLVAKLAASSATIIIGPRSGSKTASFAIPPTLAPGPLAAVIPIKITRVESLRPGLTREGDSISIRHWFEHVETALEPRMQLHDGRGLWFSHGRIHYLNGWPDAELLTRVIGEAGLPLHPLPEGVRTRRTGDHLFIFNYSTQPQQLSPGKAWEPIIGEVTLPPADVSVWQKTGSKTSRGE